MKKRKFLLFVSSVLLSVYGCSDEGITIDLDDTGEIADPGVNPDDPGINPDDPGINPDDPGVNPDDPGVNPDDPGVKPDDPGTDPQQGCIDGSTWCAQLSFETCKDGQWQSKICSAPEHGAALCDDKSGCSFACNEGFCVKGSVCADIQSDGDNCGGCSSACNTSKVPNSTKTSCIGGVCTALSCASGYVLSGAGCVPKTCTDGERVCSGLELKQCKNNAWTTLKTCTASGSHIHATCDSKAGCGIACDSGYTMCGSACADVKTDMNNCGGCGKVCSTANFAHSAQVSCTAGACKPTKCAAGYVLSGNTCAAKVCTEGETMCSGLVFKQCKNNAWTTLNTCTASGSHIHATCDSKAGCGIACDSGYTMCGSACADVKTDMNNCGGCGKVCSTANFAHSAQVSCTAGACKPTKCAAGYVLSGNTCKQQCCQYTSAVQPEQRPLEASSTVSGKSEVKTSSGFNDYYLYSRNEEIKIGIREQWGGSIVYFGMNNNGSNTIDANDTGREVQFAYYDQSRSAQNNGACGVSITYLGWNPVQGGNRCNVGSGVESINVQDGIMTASVRPLQWNPAWYRSDCVSDVCSSNSCDASKCGGTTECKKCRTGVRVIQTMRFIDPLIVELQYTMNNLESMDHPNTPGQEMPTLYTATGRGREEIVGPDLYRLIDASGNDVAIDTPANDGFLMKNFSSSEPWVTLQNAERNYGVGILYENGSRAFQGWQNRSLPFNNVRAPQTAGLAANGTVASRVYLLLGSYDTIKANAQRLQRTLPPFGALDVPANNAFVTAGSVAVSGWALDNRGISAIYARIDEGSRTALTYGGARPDVCKVWPGYPNCDSVGYSGTVNFSAFAGDKCGHLLEIIARDTDGNERIIGRSLVTIK